MTLEDARFNVHLYYRGGQVGSFFSALVEAFERADMENGTRLEEAFPEVSQALSEWRKGELKQLVS